MEQGVLPKLTSTAIRRDSIERWLQFHRDTPLRYIYGPTGSGKETSALLHARLATHPVCFLRLPPNTTAETLLDSLSSLLDIETGNAADLASALPSDERFELIISDIDQADADAREILAALPVNAPHNVVLTYVARARNVVDMVSLTTKGIGASMERDRLAFTQAEAAELCDLLGVKYSPSDVNQLIHGSDGWAFAVTGAIRDAAADGRDLRGSLARWQERHRRLIDELLARSLAGLPPSETAAAERIYAGQLPGDGPAYARLHDLGLLLSFSDSELRPLRAIANVSARRDRVSAAGSAPVSVPPANIEMFGSFETSIDGQPITWCRRRDRQLIQYLSLQPRGSATRRELISVFWPNADPQLANQSLRTACSTIRRAIAERAGYDRVPSYFSAGRDISINTDNVVISSVRFSTHMSGAEEALEVGDAALAREHFLSASKIYRGRLLDGEGTEPWFAADREAFAQSAALAAEHALELRSRKNISPLPALSIETMRRCAAM